MDPSWSELEQRVVARFVEALRVGFGEELRAVWLYGSRARGEPRRQVLERRPDRAG